MRIALIGGIFGSSAALRRNLWYTPETILQEGLGRLGHETVAFSHYQPFCSKDFDIVHVHHLSFGALRAACEHSQTPFVFTVHSTNRNHSWAREQALRLVLSRADAVVSLSTAEQRADAAAYDLRGAVHRVIYNGVDAEMYRFVPKAPRRAASPWSLLCVAHLTPIKGHVTLFSALARLPFEAELRLVYHGDALLMTLQRTAAELGIAHRVKFLGAKHPHELRELYQRADIFVLSSLSEALPSVITEAMLCGTPVIATDVGGIREQLGLDGIVVPAGDADRLAGGIKQMVDDYSQWAGRAEQISQTARDRFSTDNMIRRHCELYLDVLTRGACRRSRALARPVNALIAATVRAAVVLRGNPHQRHT